MLIPYPTCARDWYLIWQKTKTLTISTVRGDIISTPIYTVDINSRNARKKVESVRLKIGGGSLVIAFSRDFENTKDEVVYTFTGRKSTQGRWYVPERVLKALREGKEYEQ